jgi:hypothetical protein
MTPGAEKTRTTTSAVRATCSGLPYFTSNFLADGAEGGIRFGQLPLSYGTPTNFSQVGMNTGSARYSITSIAPVPVCLMPCGNRHQIDTKKIIRDAPSLMQPPRDTGPPRLA